MGGKNHQPTNVITLIAPSALLSKKIGCGIISVNEANNSLEDAIIASMNRLYVENLVPVSEVTPKKALEAAVLSLKRSQACIDEIELAFDNLMVAAKKDGYTGNPLASAVSSFDLKEKFQRAIALPAINDAAWDEIEGRVRDGNVIKTLSWERQQFDKLRVPTAALIEVLRKCEKIVDEQGHYRFVQAVECNEVELRQRYGQVFSLWNYLDAMFLYSAFIMTELFYRANGFKPLTAWQAEVHLAESVE